MSVIDQISVFDGEEWGTPYDIGVKSNNVLLSSNIAGSTNLQTALNNILPVGQLSRNMVVTTDIDKRLVASSISSSILNKALEGASTTTSLQSQIDTLNNKVNNQSGYIPKGTSSNEFPLYGFGFLTNEKKDIVFCCPVNFSSSITEKNITSVKCQIRYPAGGYISPNYGEWISYLHNSLLHTNVGTLEFTFRRDSGWPGDNHTVANMTNNIPLVGRIVLTVSFN